MFLFFRLIISIVCFDIIAFRGNIFSTFSVFGRLLLLVVSRDFGDGGNIVFAAEIYEFDTLGGASCD